MQMYHDDLELLRRTREDTLRLVGDLSETQFQFTPARRLRPFELAFFPFRVLSPPAPRWSIGEVLDHLIRFETVFRQDFATIVALKRSGRDPELRLGFGDINVSFAFIPRFFLPMLEMPVSAFSQAVPNAMVEYLTKNRLLPAQSPDIAAPRKGRRKPELCQDLRDSANLTASLFQANPDLDYRRMFRQHPTTGRQHVLEALRMIALHEQRHQQQIQEIIVEPAFPRFVEEPAAASPGPSVGAGAPCKRVIAPS
jgi:hypothetical protein